MSEKLSVVNKTPHVVTIYSGDGLDKVATIEPLLPAARCETVQVLVAKQDDILFYKTRYGLVHNLPEPKPGVIYIVSLLVQQAAPHRDDLWSPGQLVRDEKGLPVGCIGLSRSVRYS